MSLMRIETENEIVSVRVPAHVAALARKVGRKCTIAAIRRSMLLMKAELAAGVDDAECFRCLLEDQIMLDAASAYLDARDWLRTCIGEGKPYSGKH